MREVEIKAVLRDKESVLEKLQTMGCVLSEGDTQDDTTYVEKVGQTMDEFLQNTRFLRIRVTGKGETIFTVKEHKNRQKDPTGVPTEHEVQIDSREEMEHMLRIFGFEEAVRLKKTRRQGTLNSFVVCIDDVEGLGSFIELESCVPEGSDEKQIQKDMYEILNVLGVADGDYPAQRYDIALLEKRGVVTNLEI